MTDEVPRALFSGGEVLHLLDCDEDDADLDGIFFPGSDDELGFMEEVETENEKYINLLQTVLCLNRIRWVYILSQYSQEDDNDDVGGDDGISLNPGDNDSLRYAVSYQYMYPMVHILHLS